MCCLTRTGRGSTILTTLTTDIQCKNVIEDASVSHLMQMFHLMIIFILANYNYWF